MSRGGSILRRSNVTTNGEINRLNEPLDDGKHFDDTLKRIEK